MSNIEQQIVSMVFDNGSFERKLANTINSLGKLRQSMDFSGTRNNLTSIQQAIGDTNFSNMEQSVDNINNKLSALGVIGAAALQKITHGIVDVVSNLGKITFDTLVSGGKGRALNLEQARFLFEGLGIDIEKGMKSALDAVTGTAYGLDVAAKTAAQLGGSGLQAGEEMTRALRGIAGVAGVTNTSFEEMADVFVSAAGKGKVSGYELQRIGTRGLNAAAALGKQWGKTELEVREMASTGQISFKQFAEGMNDAFGDQAQKANETYTGSLANVKAALSRVGASFFGPHLKQQRDLFVTLIPVIDAIGDALSPMIEDFLVLKGLGTINIIEFLKDLDFTNLEKGIKNLSKAMVNTFKIVNDVLDIAKEAFRDIFPPSTTSLFVTLSEAVLKFTEAIKIGGKTAEKIKNVFRGVFSVFSIGIEIVKELGKFLFEFAGSLAEALGFSGGNLLNFFSDLGGALQYMKEALVDDGGIAQFFGVLERAVQGPLDIIRTLRKVLVSAFGGSTQAGVEGTTGTFERFGQRLDGLGNLFSNIGKAIDWVGERLSGLAEGFKRVGEAIGNWFSELGGKIGDALTPGDFNSVVDAVNIGLFAGLAVIFKKFIAGFKHFRIETGIVQNIRFAFIDLQRSLMAMQLELRAKALLKIALAVAVLAGSMLLLSTIDSAALTKALTAMAAGFGLLVGSFVLLEKANMGTAGIKMNVMAGSLIALAAAALLLSFAIKKLSSLGWEELAKGLVGVSVSLVALSSSTRLMANNDKGMIRAGISMIFMSTALIVLASAIKKFSAFTWGELAKGFVSVAVGLGLLVLAMNNIPTSGVLRASVAMVIISGSLIVLSKAVNAFAQIPFGEMAKGFGAIAVGLALITVVMNSMPTKRSLSNATALLVVSGALLVLAEAVQKMGAIKMGDLAKGIGGLAAMMLILAVGLNAMAGTVGGSVALVVAAGGLAILTQVIKEIANLSIAEIATGLITMALALTILGVAGYVMGPVVPVLLGLGAAMLLLGLGFAAFGAGAALLAKAFELIAKSGKAGMELLRSVIEEAIKALPRLIAAIAIGIVDAVNEILEALPAILKALAEIFKQIIETMKELLPPIVDLLGSFLTKAVALIYEHFPEITVLIFDMITFFLETLREYMPRLTQIGADIIKALLLGIENNISDITNKAIDILLKFLAAIADRTQDIVDAGVDILEELIKGITKNIEDITDAVGELITKFITEVGNLANDIIDAGVDAVSDFLDGISDSVTRLSKKFADTGVEIMEAIADAIIFTVDEAAKVLSNFLYRLGQAIRENSEEIGAAGRYLARSIIAGLVTALGLSEIQNTLKNAVEDLAGNVVGWFADKLGVGSPSKVFMEQGGYLIEGLIVGLNNGHNDVQNQAQRLGDGLTDALRETLKKSENALDGMGDLNPVIRPVLDLEEVVRGAKALDGLLTTAPISPEVSYDQAKHIATTAETSGREDTASKEPEVTEVNFVQNNYSPKALSTSDIYKNTNSQIALAKEELGV